MSEIKNSNFAVLTLNILSMETKESRKGEPYAIAQATLPMGEGRPEMPFRLIITNRLLKILKAGKTYTLLGQLGYEEKEDQATYLFFPYKYQKTDQMRNFVQLTVRAGQDAEGRYTTVGAFWARVRAALSQGKDPGGNWKPSLWLNVKAFTRDGDESLPAALNGLGKGDLFNLSGRLVYELYEGKPYLDLIATKVGILQEQPEEGGLVGEPG